MLWDCSIVFRSSIYDEQSDHHKFPMHKIKNSSINVNCTQSIPLLDQKLQMNKRITSQQQKSKELKKKKSLKTRLYSLKPKDHTHQPLSSSQTPPNFILRNLPQSFISPPHTILTSRPCTNHQKDIIQSSRSNNTNYTTFFPKKQYSINTPKDSYISQKLNLPIRINNTTPCTREIKIAYNNLPTPKNKTKQITKFNLHQKPQNLYEPYHFQNIQPLVKQFNQIQPTFKVTNFFYTRSPSINIQINKSAKFCKYPPKSNNKTPKNIEQKQDKQNIVNKINPPTQFKIDDDRPTMPSISSTSSVQDQKLTANINIKKGVKRIQDFLTSREQIKSVRDSDDISQHERSQILTNYSTILKQHGKFQIDTRT